ncbi:uncharacterized protein LOC131881667 [Tigriopus californicus]|uniref:uncharacterized protein LOC131881667 n=1 Tax=Tigriopus californicus TaxID=6832 RepID=UPI0027DA7537|nr:uncharacterized protein LOC131881667 [Tigriopus californicus]
MAVKVTCLILLGLLGISQACPAGFDYVAGKCYKMGESTTKVDAAKRCVEEEQGDHLWIIDSDEEFGNVMAHFFGSANRTRAGARAQIWTDGEFLEDGLTWITTNTLVYFEPEMGSYEGVCCSGMGCTTPNDLLPGPCAAIGRVTNSAVDAGYGFLGCECDGVAAIPYICETADVGTFQCPTDDGLFESAPCSNMFFNCFGGIPYQEYCPDEMVYDEENGYCNFPADTPSCNPDSSTSANDESFMAE